MDINIHYEYLKLKECILDYKIDWNNLSSNSNAISLLEKNICKINWDCLSENLNAIFFIGEKYR
jgi:hypothetical protein